MDSNSSNANSILKSAFIFKMIEGFKYTVKISNSKTTAVNIIKKVENKSSGSNWFIRFDNPHEGALYPHINIRHKYTGYVDPHLPLPPGGLAVAKGTAYAAKALDWLCYLTVAYDTYQLGEAIYKDHQDGTNCNTKQCATEKTGQYVGGFVGAAFGKTVGSLLIPVIGPLVGTLALGALGVKYGKELAPKGGIIGKSIGALLLPGVGPLVGAFALGCLGVSYGRQLASNQFDFEKYERERKLKEEIERELTRFVYFSRLHVNPFCD